MRDDDYSAYTNKMVKLKITKRTSAGLREMLFEELDKLRNGHTTTKQAVAIAKMASSILDTVKAEINYRSFIDKEQLQLDGKEINSIPPIQLGIAEE